MKRDIACASCAAEWRRDVVDADTDATIYPGEFIKILAGTLSTSCICDGCGADLENGARAFAISLYTASSPYFKWESAFLELDSS